MTFTTFYLARPGRQAPAPIPPSPAKRVRVSPAARADAPFPRGRNAGNRKVAKGVVVRRIAELVASDPDMPLEDAFAYCTGGMYLGKFAGEIANAVVTELAYRETVAI